MAARLNKRHQDSVRDKIKASQLINRLTDHALGSVELSATQVKAIEILLKKTVPDLSAVTLSGTGEDGAVLTQEVGRPVLSKEEWLKAHGLASTARPAG